MPVRTVALPSMPPNFVYVKTLMGFQSGLITREVYSDHFFKADITLPSFNVLTASVTDFLPNWFRPVFSPLRTSTYPTIGYQFFANVGTHVQSVLISPTWPVSTNGPALGQMFKVRVSRRAEAGGTYFWGRFAFPAVPQAWVDGNYLNSTGKAAYAVAQNLYMQPWFSQGVAFTPCGWSRKYNLTYPLTELRRMDMITHDRKSRVKDAHSNYVYVWPTVF